MSEKELTIKLQVSDDPGNNEEQEENGENFNAGQNGAEQYQQPYIYTDYGISQDEQEYSQMGKQERLALKNKKYIEILKKASTLFHDNQSRQYLIKKKKAQLEQSKIRLDQIRREKQEEVTNKKSMLADRKRQLEQTIKNQNTKISDLRYILQLLQELNSIPISEIPQQVFSFQRHISEEFARLSSNNNTAKIHSILQLEDILLDNMISIRQQVSK